MSELSHPPLPSMPSWIGADAYEYTKFYAFYPATGQIFMAENVYAAKAELTWNEISIDELPEMYRKSWFPDLNDEGSPELAQWTDLRCPSCHRWMAKINTAIPDGMKIIIQCSKCRKERTFPANIPPKRRGILDET